MCYFLLLLCSHHNHIQRSAAPRLYRYINCLILELQLAIFFCLEDEIILSYLLLDLYRQHLSLFMFAVHS